MDIYLRRPKSIQDRTCLKNSDVPLAEETIVRRQSALRGIQKLQRHFREVRATLPSGKRHLILVRTSIFQTDNWCDGKGAHATWHGWTWSFSSTLSALRHDEPPKPARDILHESRTRSPFPMHPHRCRHQASTDSNRCGEDINSPRMLSVPCAQLAKDLRATK